MCGCSWTMEQQLVGPGAVGAAQQGASVALSADGKIVLIGGPGDSYGAPGAAWVFWRGERRVGGIGRRSPEPAVLEIHKPQYDKASPSHCPVTAGPPWSVDQWITTGQEPRGCSP
jgi:hypothetical protein